MLLNYGDTLGSTRTKEDEIQQVLGVILDQQYSIKAGFKRFGERGEHAVTSELYQLQDMETFEPLDDNKPTKKDRAYALSYLILLTEKRDGRIKVRTCEDGIKKCSYIKEKMMCP